MDGLTLLERAQEAGLVVRAVGEKLIIRGPRRAESVARLLIEHKPKVLAALGSRRSCHEHVINGIERPAGWRARYAARSFHWLLDGSRSWQEAERVAWGELQCDWHWLHRARVPEWQCAGCGEPIGGLPALCLSDGNRVHLDQLDCLIRYGARWRAAATSGLAALGLQPPAGEHEP
jgi:hypothetical protein